MCLVGLVGLGWVGLGGAEGFAEFFLYVGGAPSYVRSTGLTSPVALGPTMRLVDTTFPMKGLLFLAVFTGTVD